MTLEVGGLFSGIGGIEYAFTAAGFDVSWMVEIDSFCQQVLRKHWPYARIFSDVHHVGNHNLNAVDVLCAGFPCQPFSIAGNQDGESDPRYLWPELHRVISEVRPRVVFLENVRNLRRVADGLIFNRILSQLAEIGYDAEWDCVRASDAGAPHIRERLFIVAHTSSFRQPEPRTRNSPSDEERHDSACEPGGRTEFHAAVAGRQDVEYAASAGLEESRRTEQRQGEAQNCSGVDSGVEQSGSDVVNPGGPGWQESDPSRVACDAGHLAGGYAPQPTFRLHEPSLGSNIDGLSARLVRHQFPAGQGEFQYDYEPPRTVSQKEAWHKEKIGAFGNAVVPQVIYPIALTIREWFEVV